MSLSVVIQPHDPWFEFGTSNSGTGRDAQPSSGAIQDSRRGGFAVSFRVLPIGSSGPLGFMRLQEHSIGRDSMAVRRSLQRKEGSESATGSLQAPAPDDPCGVGIEGSIDQPSW
jgi:hypothetical protein